MLLCLASAGMAMARPTYTGGLCSTMLLWFASAGGLCAYISFPDVLQNRIVHHFVDNTAALAGSIKAFSSKPYRARVIDPLVSRDLRLSCRPWLGPV